jgi:hypothetical protein
MTAAFDQYTVAKAQPQRQVETQDTIEHTSEESILLEGGEEQEEQEEQEEKEEKEEEEQHARTSSDFLTLSALENDKTEWLFGSKDIDSSTSGWCGDGNPQSSQRRYSSLRELVMAAWDPSPGERPSFCEMEPSLRALLRAAVLARSSPVGSPVLPRQHHQRCAATSALTESEHV